MRDGMAQASSQRERGLGGEERTTQSRVNGRIRSVEAVVMLRSLVATVAGGSGSGGRGS